MAAFLLKSSAAENVDRRELQVSINLKILQVINIFQKNNFVRSPLRPLTGTDK